MAGGEVMPEIVVALCTLCGECVRACPVGALSLTANCRLVINTETCRYCGDCEEICPRGAIRLPYDIVLGNRDAQN